MGFLTSVFFLAAAASQVPLGILLDRFGPRRVNAALLGLAAFGAAVAAMADSYAWLVAARFLVGVGTAACFMAAIQAFVLWFPANRTASMVAWAYSVGAVGLMTVGTPLEMMLRHVTWQGVFWILGVFTLLLSVALTLAVPERAGAAVRLPLRTQMTGVRKMLADKGFWCIAAVLAVSQASTVALFSLWMATWLRDVAHLDRAAVGRAIFLAALAQLAGYLFFGRWADARTRAGKSSLPLFAGGVALAALSLGCLAAGITWLSVATWAIFTFGGAAAVLGLSIGVRRYPPAMAATVNTTVNTVTISAIFLAQWGVGEILNLWPSTPHGYNSAAYSWALACLVALQAISLAFLLLGRRHARSPAPGA